MEIFTNNYVNVDWDTWEGLDTWSDWSADLVCKRCGWKLVYKGKCVICGQEHEYRIPYDGTYATWSDGTSWNDTVTTCDYNGTTLYGLS